MPSASAYSAETDGVVVRVQPSYLAAQSDPEANHWVWAYQIEIVNLTGTPLQLVARRWTITDALGRVEEVRGSGVVGEQPVIEPGDSFAYASGCPLTTPSGSMVGAYFMQDPEGHMFEVAVPHFSLDVPDARRTLN
ncbi:MULTISPECIES: Co2+/Mg2+ efflux protein ApaG [unclassified Brevundimonas]|uniref:Co2+/Mg2+ efflux protein ApaG n=1 Tax=unclassified Brevundimonas TaxID=2622653 RepID=UPI0025C4D152|nr:MULTISPECIES: Co2+/Mg2+ efflux protein ApaG [unclassified Brevundimonas]